MNQGAGSAGPSLTAVEFEDLGRFSQPTPSLAPGAMVELQFTIPRGCFGPGFDEICNFKIMLDAQLAVAESEEINNAADGGCFVAL